MVRSTFVFFLFNYFIKVICVTFKKKKSDSCYFGLQLKEMGGVIV